MHQKIITVNGSPIKVEVADTQDLRQDGLMHRDSLESNCGMLFIFEDSGPRGFWMKNTRIPLSIAFISDSGEILNIEDMHPHDMSTVRSQGPARCALEMNQGWFKNNGVAMGDIVGDIMIESIAITKRQIRDIVNNIILN